VSNTWKDVGAYSVPVHADGTPKMECLPYVPPTPSPWESTERVLEARNQTLRAIQRLIYTETGDERMVALANLEFACKYETQVRNEVSRKEER
jgi:hypothetical protein